VGSILSARVPEAGASLSERVAHARLAWACARESGSNRTAASAAGDALRAALAELSALPEGARPDLSLPLRIDLASELDPAAALHALDATRAAAERIGHAGSALAAHIRAADIAADHDPQRARTEALAALALAAQGRQNTVLLPAELWLHAARALHAAGDTDAAQRVLQEGLGWLQQTAREQVPEPFRESFLHRNPANRALLALASRLGRRA